MRILFLTGRETAYMRNAVLLRAFQRFATVDVAAAAVSSRSIVLRSARTAVAALGRLRRQYDLVFVGFYGYLLMQTVGRLTRAPLLFDAFVSNYDTICFDRKRFAPTSPAGRLLFHLDRNTLRLAAHTLLDTELHVDYFAQTFGAPRDRLTAVPVGCREDLFAPQPLPTRPPGSPTQILYYCTYQPLHGVGVVVEALARLRDQPLHLRLIGDGPQRAAVEGQARRAGLTNVTFENTVSQTELARAIATADLCLAGHFGPGDKAGRVVPGKLYQLLAMQRASIASDSPANRALLTHAQTAYLTPAGDAAALADALLALHHDPALRRRIAEQGHALYWEALSEARITERVQAVTLRLIDERHGR